MYKYMHTYMKGTSICAMTPTPVCTLPTCGAGGGYMYMAKARDRERPGRTRSRGRGGHRASHPDSSAPLSPSSEYVAHKTVKARFWPWLSGECPETLSRCSLFAWKRLDLDVDTLGA